MLFDGSTLPGSASPKMHENTLIAVIIGFLMALVLLGCAGWYVAKYRVKGAFKEDRELARDTEKGINSTHVPRNNNRGWVRPPKKEIVISNPNYVLIMDGDGHRVRRGGRLARELQNISPGNGSQGQQRSQSNQKQRHNQSKRDDQSKQNKWNKQHNKDQKKNDLKTEHKKTEDKTSEKTEDKKSEGKKNEDRDDHQINSQGRQGDQKHRKNDAWGVWESDSPAKPNDQKESDSNKGNQENQDQGNWNEQNDWNVDNQGNQDNHDQGHWDEQNKLNDDNYGDQANQDRDNWKRNHWNGGNENGQNDYYQSCGSRNDDNYNKWNNELGPKDSISNQKRKNNGGDLYRHGKRNSRSHRQSANKSSANKRNRGHQNSRTRWSSKYRQGLPPNDQGTFKDDKPKSDRSKIYDNAMNSQVPMDDQKKDAKNAIQEKW